MLPPTDFYLRFCGPTAEHNLGMEAWLRYPRHLAIHRAMIGAMVLREIRSRFAGTLGGFAWSVINPLAMVLVYWFIFSVGLRVQPMGDVPFIVYFVCGMMPWSMFNEALHGGVNSITGNPYLVTKTVFPTEVLPIVYLGASLVSHGAMLAILVLCMAAGNVPITWHVVGVPYYLVALMTFTLGLSWLLSALNVFYRDVREVLGVLLNIWFWFTPVVWGFEIVPERLRPIFQLNPMYHIVTGYRNAFIFGQPPWREPWVMAWFWAACAGMFLTGAWIFRRLKPEFPEAL